MNESSLRFLLIMTIMYVTRLHIDDIDNMGDTDDIDDIEEEHAVGGDITEFASNCKERLVEVVCCVIDDSATRVEERSPE